MVSPYRDRKILVTGGLGFIGSNLAIALARDGAHVTVVDSSAPGCGANARNLSMAGSSVRVIHDDIGNASNFAASSSICSTIRISVPRTAIFPMQHSARSCRPGIRVSFNLV